MLCYVSNNTEMYTVLQVVNAAVWFTLMTVWGFVLLSERKIHQAVGSAAQLSAH